jgi:hypothetical protein
MAEHCWQQQKEALSRLLTVTGTLIMAGSDERVIAGLS